MTEDPRHWARVDELFAEALSLEAGEREAYLDRACGIDEAWFFFGKIFLPIEFSYLNMPCGFQ